MRLRQVKRKIKTATDASSEVETDDANMPNEILDRMLQGMDNAVPHGKTNLTTCQGYLLEAKHTDKVTKLECGQDSCLQNAGLESHSPGVYKEDSTEMSDLSCESTPRLGYKDNGSLSLDHRSVQEQHEAFTNMLEHETPVIDEQWLKHHISPGLQNYIELKSGSNITEYAVISNQNEGITSSIKLFGRATSTIKGSPSKESIHRDLQVKRKKHADHEFLKTSDSWVSEVELCSLDGGDNAGGFALQKRLRRPPRRYVEESSECKSKFYSRKCGVACKRSKNRFLYVTSDKRNWKKEIQEETIDCQDKSSEVGCTQVPFGLPLEKGQLEEDNSALESEDCKKHGLLGSSEKLEIEYSPADSKKGIYEDECASKGNTQKVRKRKTHYIAWTSSEVMKLIEGVSQYGVGKWSKMKRLLFPSCSHRTAVDIKDKWRNLLKASRTQLPSKIENESEGTKQASHQVPESVLQRVKELAVIYPYPLRKRSTANAPATSSSSTAVKGSEQVDS